MTQAGDDPRISELHAFWEASRGANRFPAQCDLDLVSIPALLPHMFIIDRLDDGDFLSRFVGTALDEHFGVSLTGKTLSYYRSGQVLEVLQDFFQKIIDTGQMGILTTRLSSETRDWALYTRAALPLADDHEHPNKIVGIILVHQSGDVPLPAPSLIDVERRRRGLVQTEFRSL